MNLNRRWICHHLHLSLRNRNHPYDAFCAFRSYRTPTHQQLLPSFSFFSSSFSVWSSSSFLHPVSPSLTASTYAAASISPFLSPSRASSVPWRVFASHSLDPQSAIWGTESLQSNRLHWMSHLACLSDVVTLGLLAKLENAFLYQTY